jgi:hypothetical protein
LFAVIFASQSIQSEFSLSLDLSPSKSNPRARDALRLCLPEALTDQSFGEVIRSEEAVQRWLAHLLKNLSDKGTTATPSATAASTPAATTNTTTGAKPGAPQNPFSAQGAWQNTPATQMASSAT